MVALQAGLGKYCVHLLADYITVAAAPPLPADTDSAASVDGRSNGLQAMEPLAGLPGAALRQGALALYGACSPAEVSAAAAAVFISACSTPQSCMYTCQVAYQFIFKIKNESHQLSWQLRAQPGVAPSLAFVEADGSMCLQQLLVVCHLRQGLPEIALTCAQHVHALH